MFAAHAAAALALRGRDRAVPVEAYVAGAFVLDLAWIATTVTAIDRTPWNDWSHSLLLSLAWATAYAVAFRRWGTRAMIALWLAVMSHFVLDLLTQGTNLYPRSSDVPQIPILVETGAWLFQMSIVTALLIAFVRDDWRAGVSPARTIASCLVVLAMSLR